MFPLLRDRQTKPDYGCELDYDYWPQRPSAVYLMNDVSTKVEHDISGNNLTATINGVNRIGSVDGPALGMDGLTTFLSAVNNTSVSNITLAASVRFDYASFNGNTNPRIFDVHDGINSVQLAVDGATGNWFTKSTVFQSGTTGFNWQVGPTLGVLYSVIASFTATGTLLWVNGIPQSAISTSNIGASSATNVAYLGVRSDLQSTTYLKGRLGRCVIFPFQFTTDMALNKADSPFADIQQSVWERFYTTAQPQTLSPGVANVNVTEAAPSVVLGTATAQAGVANVNLVEANPVGPPPAVTSEIWQPRGRGTIWTLEV